MCHMKYKKKQSYGLPYTPDSFMKDENTTDKNVLAYSRCIKIAVYIDRGLSLKRNILQKGKSPSFQIL